MSVPYFRLTLECIYNRSYAWLENILYNIGQALTFPDHMFPSIVARAAILHPFRRPQVFLATLAFAAIVFHIGFYFTDLSFHPAEALFELYRMME